MRRIDETRYDFRTDTWVRDDFLSPPNAAAGRAELPEPGTPPTEGFWTATEGPRVGLRERLRAGGTGRKIFWLIALCLVFLAFIRVGGGAAGALAFFAFFIGLLAPFDAPPWALSAADRRLFEDPTDPEVCLVDLGIVRDGALVGRDRGVAWFQDGRLLFNGHRCSFAIGGEDVLPRSRWSVFDHQDPLWPIPDESVPLRLAGARAHVVTVPVSSKHADAQRQEILFLRRLSAFRLRPPQSRGPRQWPPFEP